MSESKVSLRYAKSLISLAGDKNQVDQVKDDMLSLLSIYHSSKPFRLMIASPIIGHHKKSEILKATFTNKVTNITFLFFNLLAVKRREQLLADIAESYIQEFNRLRNIHEAVLITAYPVDSATKHTFIKFLENKGYTNVSLTSKVEEGLIGGFLLKIEDLQFDGSIRNQLDKLKYQLTYNPYIPKL